MSLKHKASKCTANYICKKCNGHHHVSICQKGNLKSTGIVRTPHPTPPLQRGWIDFLKFGNKGGDKIFFLERKGLD